MTHFSCLRGTPTSVRPLRKIRAGSTNRLHYTCPSGCNAALWQHWLVSRRCLQTGQALGPFAAPFILARVIRSRTRQRPPRQARRLRRRCAGARLGPGAHTSGIRPSSKKKPGTSRERGGKSAQKAGEYTDSLRLPSSPSLLFPPSFPFLRLSHRLRTSPHYPTHSIHTTLRR